MLHLSNPRLVPNQLYHFFFSHDGQTLWSSRKLLLCRHWFYALLIVGGLFVLVQGVKVSLVYALLIVGGCLSWFKMLRSYFQTQFNVFLPPSLDKVKT